MTVVLIPAYEPGGKLLKLLFQICSRTNYQIVVVDDGSGEEYEDIFEAVRKMGCTVLHHGENRGKGSALKTGFTYIEENCNGVDAVVTADCDGQHTITDIIRLAETVEDNGVLLLGSRQFQGKVPKKSRIGNTLSRKLFSFFTGQEIEDTQTGLRAFPASMLPWLIHLPGSRFDYEQNMLFDCRRQGYKLREIPIETIYENENKGTHFRAVRDSLLVAFCFLRFSAVSLFCAATDFLLVDVFYRMSGNLLVAVVGTRLCTALMQYLLNHFLVFRERKEEMRRSSIRYLALAACMLALNYGEMYLFTKVFLWSLLASKLVTELILFVFSYYMQKNFVFVGAEEL